MSTWQSNGCQAAAYQVGVRDALLQVLVKEALRILIVGSRILGIDLCHQNVQGRLLEAHFVCVPSVS